MLLLLLLLFCVELDLENYWTRVQLQGDMLHLPFSNA